MTRLILMAAPLAILLGLAGCDDGVAPENTTRITVPEGGYHSRLQAMGEGQRNAVFIRALRDAKRECQHVESSTLAGEISGAPAWRVRCRDSGDWLVMIGRSGIAQVVSAAEAARAGLPVGTGNGAAPEGSTRQ